MSLLVSGFPSQFSSAPVDGAYAYIAALGLDLVAGEGLVTVNVNHDPAAAAAGLPPIAQKSYPLGQGPMPTLAQLVADNQAAFDAIRGYLYGKLKSDPVFASATDVA